MPSPQCAIVYDGGRIQVLPKAGQLQKETSMATTDLLTLLIRKDVYIHRVIRAGRIVAKKIGFPETCTQAFVTWRACSTYKKVIRKYRHMQFVDRVLSTNRNYSPPPPSLARRRKDQPRKRTGRRTKSAGATDLTEIRKISNSPLVTCSPSDASLSNSSLSPSPPPPPPPPTPRSSTPPPPPLPPFPGPR